MPNDYITSKKKHQGQLLKKIIKRFIISFLLFMIWVLLRPIIEPISKTIPLLFSYRNEMQSDFETKVYTDSASENNLNTQKTDYDKNFDKYTKDALQSSEKLILAFFSSLPFLFLIAVIQLGKKYIDHKTLLKLIDNNGYKKATLRMGDSEITIECKNPNNNDETIEK